MKRKIVLASTSPRRKELLEKLGLTFEIDPSNYEEDMTLDLPPQELVKTLSKGKAQAVATRHEDAIVIGSDCIVFSDRVLGKPKDEEDAKKVLKSLSGKAHEVFTGVTVIDTKNKIEISRVGRTKVFFKNISDEQIEEYVKSGEPMGKGGSYAIQLKGSEFVEKIEGDITTVIGLPLEILTEILKELEVDII